MRIVFMLLLTLIGKITLAQLSVDQLASYMEKVRTGTYDPVPAVVLEDDTNELAQVNMLISYTQDTVPRIRLKAYDILSRIGTKSTQSQVRERVITQLIIGIGDADSGISGNASGALADFQKSDFTADHKTRIREYLVPATPHLDQVIKLAGYLEMEVVSQLKLLYTNSELSSTERLSAQLALVRLGEEASKSSLLARLSGTEVNDDFVYDIVPALVYTRQKEVFDFLVQIIQSDERNCFSANPSSETRILCGYRVMEYIAPAVVNYPLPVDEFGELDVNNYRQALITVREWFEANPDYEVNRNSF